MVNITPTASIEEERSDERSRNIRVESVGKITSFSNINSSHNSFSSSNPLVSSTFWIIWIISRLVMLPDL